MVQHRAVLDDDGVYCGHEPVPKRYKPKPSDVMVPDDCDLEPGGYRWDGNGKCFVPIKSPEPEDLVREPNTLRAIALGFQSLDQAGVTLHSDTVAWVRWFKKTMDAKG